MTNPEAGTDGTTRPLLLDLFCGAGGAAMGYHRAGFDIVGVDIKPQPRYPFKFVQADALDFLRRWEPLPDNQPSWVVKRDFVAIHASPPCQHASRMRALTRREYVNLIPQTKALLQRVGLPWVLENVPDADIQKSVQLCGTMFGLEVSRHRKFEISGFTLNSMLHPCSCRGGTLDGRIVAFRNGGGPRLDRGGKPKRRPKRCREVEFRDALGCHWMNTFEARQAIPPAYTEWIGKQLLPLLDGSSAVPSL